MSAENAQTLVTVEPEQQAKACVIWLHGLGADGYDFQPIVPYLKLPQLPYTRFLFPHAEVMPVTVNGGMPMRAWYDILEMSVDRKVDKTTLISSAKRIQHLIEQQIAEGIPSEKIVLIGFSQGGAVAYHTSLCSPQTLAGVAALSTYMATVEEIHEQHHRANANIPVWLGHGLYDDVVPALLGEKAQAELIKMGLRPEWHSYPIGHEVCLEEMEALGEWISQRLGELN